MNLRLKVRPNSAHCAQISYDFYYRDNMHHGELLDISMGLWLLFDKDLNAESSKCAYQNLVCVW
jgi:hypothetical protein